MHTYIVNICPPGATTLTPAFTGVVAIEFIYTDVAILFIGEDKAPVLAVPLSLNPTVVRTS